MSWLPPDEAEEYSEYDESAARVRPNPKGNRPRSKTRPEHADAVLGRVFSVDRGRFGVWIHEGTPDERQVIATGARELGRGAVVTGDRVDVVGDLSGEDGSLARIVRVQPRETLLRRSADDTDAVERVIVANADQMLIVVAVANPEPRPRLVDRYLVAAFDAGIAPILVVTKIDLADPSQFLANFDGLDLDVILSASDDPPIAELERRLDGHTTVAVGHSGVGKSTLVNALVPDANRAIGIVNAVTGRGRHTSSSTISYKLGVGLDRRHPRRALVRPRPREPRQPARLVHRPRRGRRGLPARLHPPGRRPGLRAERSRRGGHLERGARGLPAAPAAHAQARHLTALA